MTRTEKRIQNLMVERGELIADIAERSRRHMPRACQERELRAKTEQIIRLENALHKASRRRQTSHGLTLPGDGGSPHAVGGSNA